MRKLKIVVALILLITFSACTEKQRAKSLGGQFEIKLPKGQKLIEATWKNDNLWYLTRARRENEKTETYLFKEDSSFGVMEGSVKFIEQ